MQTAVTQNHHQLPIQVNQHLVTFCTVAVFLYALTRLWIGAKISAYFEAAFLLPFYYIVFKNWWYFKKQFLTWLVIAMLAVPVLQFCVQYYQDPVLAMKYQGVDKLFRLTFFLAPAFWLAHNLKLVPWFIAANLISLLFMFGSQSELELFIKYGINGYRSHLGSVDAQFAAAYSGLALLSLVYLITNVQKCHYTIIKHILYIFILLISTVLIFIIITTQTRAVFFSLFTGLITCLILAAKNYNLKRTLSNPFKVIISTILVVIALYGTYHTQAMKRLMYETNHIIDYFQDTSENAEIPNNNIGYRLQLWKIGSINIVNTPLIGHGGESRKSIITSTPNISAGISKSLHHFHNSFFEFGVAFGLPGVFLILILFFWLFYISYLDTKLTFSTKLLTIYGLIYTIGINIFESYLFFWQGGYLLTWLMLPLLAKSIYSDYEKEINELKSRY